MVYKMATEIQCQNVQCNAFRIKKSKTAYTIDSTTLATITVEKNLWVRTLCYR